MLKIIRKTIDENDKLITELDKQIDLSIAKYEVELQLLQIIDGVERDTAITVISEIGVDMNRFENEHHLASWAGLSSRTNETAGKKKYPSHPRKQTPSIGISRGDLGSNKEEARLFESLLSQIIN